MLRIGAVTFCRGPFRVSILMMASPPIRSTQPQRKRPIGVPPDAFQVSLNQLKPQTGTARIEHKNVHRSFLRNAASLRGGAEMLDTRVQKRVSLGSLSEKSYAPGGP